MQEYYQFTDLNLVGLQMTIITKICKSDVTIEE